MYTIWYICQHWPYKSEKIYAKHTMQRPWIDSWRPPVRHIHRAWDFMMRIYVMQVAVDPGVYGIRRFRSQDWVMVSNIFHFHPYLGKIPILTNIFQLGWNHRLEEFMSQLELSIIGWFVWKVGRCVNFECVHIFGSMSGSIWFGSQWIRQCIAKQPEYIRHNNPIIRISKWNSNVSRAISMS